MLKKNNTNKKKKKTTISGKYRFYFIRTDLCKYDFSEFNFTVFKCELSYITFTNLKHCLILFLNF